MLIGTTLIWMFVCIFTISAGAFQLSKSTLSVISFHGFEFVMRNWIQSSVKIVPRAVRLNLRLVRFPQHRRLQCFVQSRCSKAQEQLSFLLRGSPTHMSVATKVILKLQPTGSRQLEINELQDSFDGDGAYQGADLEQLLKISNSAIEDFASYYREQRIFPESELPLFIKSMKEPSPVDFRVNPGAQLADVLQEVLLEASKRSHPPGISLQQCTWYPRGLAWRFFPHRSDCEAWMTSLLV